MKCADCHRPIASGADMARRAEYRSADGITTVYGPGMPGGPLSAASGRLVMVKHNGCYWTAAKRAQRSR